MQDSPNKPSNETCETCGPNGLKMRRVSGRTQIHVPEDFMSAELGGTGLQVAQGMDVAKQFVQERVFAASFESRRLTGPLPGRSVLLKGSPRRNLLDMDTPRLSRAPIGRAATNQFTLAGTSGRDVLPMLQEKEGKPLEMPPKKEEGGKAGEKAKNEGPPKPKWGAPKEGEDFPAEPAKEDEHAEVEPRPKKDGGPKIVLPGQDDVKDFDKEWDDSDVWLPDGPVLLACPSEVEHKVQIFWVDEEDVGIAKTRADAEKLAAGALEAHKPQEIAEKGVTDGLLETQVNALLDDRGWTCAPECKRSIELSGYLYHVHVMAEVTAAVQMNDDGSTEDTFVVKLFIVHRLYAWVKIICKA